MASAALGSLCGLRRWLESQGRCLRIAAISTEVRSIMEACGLLRLFTVDDDSGRAVPKIGPDGRVDNPSVVAI
jgi:anti-anti-sigma regulatory factor